MTKQNNDTRRPIYVAIDVAKKFHELVICSPSGKTKAMKIANSRKGFDQLIDATKPQDNKVIAAIEPTADYHRLIAYLLHDSGIEMHLAIKIST